MEKNYLEITRGSQIYRLRDRVLFRFLEFLPGAFSWLTLLITFVLSYLAPIVVALFIIIFDLFWLARIFYLSFHQIVSFRKMQKNLRIDWLKKLKSKNPDSWKNIYHLIILPMYREGFEIVDSTCQALEKSSYPKEKMIVILAIEERAGEKAREIAQRIQEKWQKSFFRFLVTYHPEKIEGEVAGKGSNVAWALKQAREKIINPFLIPHKDIIVSSFDIDTRPYPQYFACLTWHYLNTTLPLQSSYQPIPLYNNNIWEAPAFSRVISTSGSFWQMMQQERPEQLVTYSSHSFPFQVFKEMGYPSNLVSDDSRIFWKAFLFYNGNYKVTPLYYPVSMDAVLARNLIQTIINQYKQQRRWAWGVENIPYLLYGFFKNKKIPLYEKFRHSVVVLEGFWSWATSALLIFFLGWLPLVLGGQEFNITLLSYNLPRLTSNLMSLAMIGMIIGAIISMSILPPRPPRYGKWKTFSLIFQWLFLPLTLIIFGALPALEAQTRLMLGRHLGFWPTEKVRQ
ncbi:hypothetical protein AMJ50_00515 [Parcubacteria bacterium DG_74_3]|nr:MAG: hypothetical protein AMJ50_00515 [Parcubacteria bacterium DG_74_3]